MSLSSVNMKQKAAYELTGGIGTVMSIELDNRPTPFPARQKIIFKCNKYIN